MHALVCIHLRLDHPQLLTLGLIDVWRYNDPAATCFYNSDVNIVGDRAPFQTTCVNGAELSAGPCITCSGSVLEWCVPVLTSH